MKISVVLFALIPSIAFATQPPKNPSGDDISSSSESAALGVGVGVGIGEGGDAKSNSTAVGIGGNSHAVSGSHSGASSGSLSSAHNQASNVALQNQNVANTNTLGNDSRNTNANENAASASNDGNSLSTSYQNDTTALALGLGSTTAAPIDSSICRKDQTAGWRVAVIERTGRNKFDQDCLGQVLDEELRQADFTRCMDIANAYLKVRLEQAFAAQLEKCGGVLERALISSSLAQREPITQGSSVQYATKEELDRAFNAAQSK